MKNGVHGKILEPTVEQITAALRCTDALDTPDGLGCANKKCKYRDVDGACDIVSMCFDAATLIDRLNDFDQTQSKLALERCQRAEAQLAQSQRRERAAVEDSALRKSTELTPIYTCGGHGGYYDDDDEDFWCPICHAHLGTHKGFETTCPRCGQRVNHDSEPLYNYRDMRESEADWRGQGVGEERTE
ncbi:hypothetical protein [Oscillibacter sp.]|uniref:hypothetical protein n=1 Tax=Oscillibacter sp. TaxID=1945593 RepID=UPI0028997330|nr:hypothetical protein [Oscillibacter sp.]